MRSYGFFLVLTLCLSVFLNSPANAYNFIQSDQYEFSESLENCLDRQVTEDSRFNSWTSFPSNQVDGRAQVVYLEENEDGVIDYREILKVISVLEFERSAQLRLIFETEMAGCIASDWINSLNDKAIESMLIEGSGCEKIVETEEKGMCERREGAFTENQVNDLSGNFVDNLVYTVSNIAWEQLESEFEYYISNQVQDRMCKDGIRIVAARACNKLGEFENQGFDVPWQSIVRSLRQDARQLLTSSILFQECRDDADDATKRADCILTVYSKNQQIYAMSFLYILASTDSRSDLVNTLPSFRDIVSGFQTGDSGGKRECDLPEETSFYSNAVVEWLNCLTDEYRKLNPQVDEFVEKINAYSEVVVLLNQRQYINLYNYVIENYGSNANVPAALEMALLLAEQDDVEGMNVVLANYVAPVGSYRNIARNRGIRMFASISVDAWESGVDENPVVASRLGLEVSGPLPNTGWYFGGQFVLFDLTSNLYLEEDEVESVNGYAETIFRPGLGAFLSIGKSPFILHSHYDFEEKSPSVGLGFRTTVFDIKRF